MRDRTAGLFFHALNRGAKRAVLFEDHADYAAFEAVIEEGLQRERVEILAYCGMPTHWHFVLTPTVDGALSRFMHWLETTHARRWQSARGLTGLGAVYQGRFRAIPIGADQHFLWVCRYVERNPVRAGLVERAEDWPWSSLRRRDDGREGWLAEWPIPRPVEWREFVNTPQTETELAAFRQVMRNGTPFGEEAWKQEVMAMLGKSPRRPRGRPRRHPQATVL